MKPGFTLGDRETQEASLLSDNYATSSGYGNGRQDGKVVVEYK